MTVACQDIAFGVGLREGEDDLSIVEVVPVKRYDSHRMAVKGSLRVDKPGTYVLIFDNTYSKLTSKRVTYFADVKDDKQVEPAPEISGWLLKRKKVRGLQPAYSRRWCTLLNGQLSYFKNPNSYCRGTIDVTKATVAVSVRARELNVDNGQTLFHLKGSFTLLLVCCHC